jgi:predicted carbohydrate-binding protein with starch-binding CBM53
MVATTKAGGATDIWRNDLDDGYSPFTKNVNLDGLIEIESGVTAALPVTAEQRQAWLAGEIVDTPLATEKIVYYAPGAGEVWLVWGLEGWRAIPEAARPQGTVLKDDGLMHTRMVRMNDIFTTLVRIPPGMRIDIRFLITKMDGGTPIQVGEDVRGKWYLTMSSDSLIKVESKATPLAIEQRKAWLAGTISDIPLLAQEIGYRSMRPDDVWLLWGIEGWRAIPETARPPGTVLKNGLMYTKMVRKDKVFTTTVRVPPGTVINYEFLIDKPHEPLADGQSEGNRLGTSIGPVDGRVEFESRVTKVTMEQRKTWPPGRLADIALVAQEIRYRIAGAEDVWLVWGINGWQAIPDAARPPGTVLKDNQVMHSRMVRKGDTFATTVRVPPGTMLDYKFLITKTSRGAPVSIWQDYNGRDFWKLVRVNGSLDEKATVTVVTLDERKAWLSGQAADLPLVTQELRYHVPGAAEVWLAWGLDGWQAIPESARPGGTVLKNGRLYTSMVREGTTFTTTIRVPPGTGLDFSFLITKTEDRKIIEIRQDKDKEGRELSMIVAFDGRIEVQSTAWLSAEANHPSLVAQEIRYRIAGTEEVWLVWGINGWQAIPETARPSGTVLKDNQVMHTRMVRKGDTFTSTVRVPPGTKLDYKFLITKTSRGAPVNIWQDYNGQDFGKLVRVSGSLEEKATVTVVTPDQSKAWLAGQTADLPLVTQEIRYRAPGAADVWLAWGLDGWQPIPEAARPAGTVLNHGRMQTPMIREGHTFVVKIQIPPGTEFDFWFLITKTEEGKVVDIRQEKDPEGRKLSRVVAFDGWIEVQSTAWLTRSLLSPSS